MRWKKICSLCEETGRVEYEEADDESTTMDS